MKILKKLPYLLLFFFALIQGCSMLFPPEGAEGADALSALSFSRSSLQIAAGGMDMLSLRAEPDSLQPSLSISWEFDSAVISAVFDNYSIVITGLRPGTTALRARSGSLTAACAVTVTSDPASPQILYPYVYANTDIVNLAPGGTEQITASLFGGIPSDINGFSYTIDKPAAASLRSEGNYLWITGKAEGDARVSVRHTKAAYPYTFLVSCRADGLAVPYITTAANIITLNKSAEKEALLAVSLQNPPDGSSSDSLFSFTLTGAEGGPPADPPVTLISSGRQAVITPRSSGECYITVEHEQALYPLNVLVRVIENIDTVYIEPSSSLVQVQGASSQTVSVSLVNVPPSVSAGLTDFTWAFSDNAGSFIDTAVYGGESEGKGNQLWITGKKQGTVKVTVSHPLSSQPREIIIMASRIPSEAAQASTFITASQNYVQAYAGAGDTVLAVSINNARPGDENNLSWRIEHTASDGSGSPVIAFTTSSGSASDSTASLAAAPLAFTAQGSAHISPLRKGSASITISHPRAVYDTKILVSVLDGPAAGAPSNLALTTAVPYIAVKNGSSVTANAALSGPDKTSDDEQAVRWQASGSYLSVASNGVSAQISALGSGFSRETITVTRPKAAFPLEIAVSRYDTEEELAAHKTLVLASRFRALAAGASDYLYASLVNGTPSDYFSWNVTQGGNSVIVFEQTDNRSARITAAAPGSASVSVSAAGLSSSFEITVTDPRIINSGAPCYLTASQNVTVMDSGQSADISVTPVNIYEHSYGQIQWTASDPRLIELIPNGSSASVRALAEGKVKLTVSHPLAANSLELFVHIGGEYEYKNADTAYISASADTVVLAGGASDYLLQAVLARTERTETQASGFSFQIKDASIASVQPAGSAACLVSPLKPGLTVLTISHPDAVFPKEVPVIIERGSEKTPYITTAQNVIAVPAGEYTTAAVQLANADSYNAAEWTWTVQDQSVARIAANNGPAAMIAGIAPGASFLTASNSRAPYPLSLILICLDKRQAQLNPWIKTSADILTVKTGASAALSAEMIGGSDADNQFFSWSAADPLTALVSPASDSANVRGLKAGQTYITVSNTARPDSYPKSVLVIVEDSVQDDCYITADKQIVKLTPTAANGASVKASLVNGGPLDPENFIWRADDYRIVSLTALAGSANIQPAGLPGTTAVHVKHPKALSPLDIIVTVSAFDQFAFARPSITVTAGGFAFVPLQIPALPGNPAAAYESLNSGVCAVAGSSSVAMIAGISPGTTSVRASLTNNSGVIDTADIAVIVSPPAPNANKIISSSPLITLEYGQSLTISADPSGANIIPGDKYSLQWSSSDPLIVEVKNGNGFTGADAFLTAKKPGEAVISVSHPKCPSPLSIWIKVPDIKDKSLSLDQTYIQLFKNEGSAAVTASIYNGVSSDYNSILWTVSKAGSLPVVSLFNTSGRTCTVMPRNAGQAVLRTQLPNGSFQDCLINVSADASLTLETLTVRVNPQYSHTVKYTVSPDNAAVTWFSQADNAANPGSIFSYLIDPLEKTITVTGNSLGSGSVSGYITSTSGAKMVTLQVFVEYTYSFSFIDFPLHPVVMPDKPFTVKFKVFPPDLDVSVSCSAPDKLSVPPKADLDPLTGLGQIVCSPTGEAAGITLSFSASLPSDPKHSPISGASAQRTLDLMYTDYRITPVFDIQAGSFSNYTGGTLYLGDGEDMGFYFVISDQNADPSGVKIEWIPPPGSSSLDIREKKDNGHIILSTEGSNRYRIKHDTDYAPTENYYLITRDLFYDIFYEKYGYTNPGDVYNGIPPGGRFVEQSYNGSLSAKNGEGITRWYAD
jgi:hypothetical protein